MTDEQKAEIADVRIAARAMTTNALNALKEVVEDKSAPHSARVSAATTILDRGWGKATQVIEATVTNNIDSMDADQLRAFIAGEIAQLGAGVVPLAGLGIAGSVPGKSDRVH